MAKIKVMSEELSNKIAAGEVVERPASVVKEILENSLDAKSKNIKIDLVESGLLEITVTDDGVGMDKEDALLAFKRHATSKLITEYDLLKIITLGFRGEALPSIASVSDVTLKTSNGVEGSFVNIKGGKLLENSLADLKKGTKISVKNLFYNTPARLKYLKNTYTELAHISDYVQKIALSRPDVSFSLFNNGKSLLRTDGKNDLLKVISSVYSIDVAKDMLKVEAKSSDFKIEGYVSSPTTQRASRNYTTIIVNGRIIKSAKLTKSIIDCYYTYIPHNRYPISVIRIDVDPTLIDVNVHPNKLEVKFSKEEQLINLITDSVSQALKNKLFTPKVSLSKEIKTEKIEPQKFDFSYNKLKKEKLIVTEPNSTYDKKNEEIYVELEKKEIKEKQEPKEEIQTLVLEEPIERQSLVIYPIGQVMGTYIVGQNENGIYLIDQHAAQERIRYEYYRNQSINNQDVKSLLIPLVLEYSLNESLIIENNLDIIRELNVEIEKFGLNSFVVKSHPSWFLEGSESVIIEKMLSQILREKKINVEKIVENLIITMSCKLSIKANQYLNIKEMEHLIKDLMMCKNPNTCPHGRPIIVHITEYELQKMFKRVV